MQSSCAGHGELTSRGILVTMWRSQALFPGLFHSAKAQDRAAVSAGLVWTGLTEEG